MAELSELLGKTLTGIDREGDDRLVFHVEGGKHYLMFHSQDCCESVSIDDIAGDLSDLVGSPITKAEEVTHENENPPGLTKECQDSFTWTFYHFATVKGYVTIRWYGESNGWYSESVNFEEYEPVKP